MNTQFKKGVLEMCVIAALYDRDCYGYELVNGISKCVRITEGTIYPILKRLSDDGYVTTYLKESNGGAPRKYYNLNESGKKHGLEMFKDWFLFTKNVDVLLQDVKKIVDEQEEIK